jgi:hypothetical protein
MSNKQLPSHIKHDTSDAYNHAYSTLYCGLHKDVRDMIDKAKQDDTVYANLSTQTDYASRTAYEFFREVRRMAELKRSAEEIKDLERHEKSLGIHVSQRKKVGDVKHTIIETPLKEDAEPKTNNNKLPDDNKQDGNAS